MPPRSTYALRLLVEERSISLEAFSFLRGGLNSDFVDFFCRTYDFGALCLPQSLVGGWAGFSITATNIETLVTVGGTYPALCPVHNSLFSLHTDLHPCPRYSRRSGAGPSSGGSLGRSRASSVSTCWSPPVPSKRCASSRPFESGCTTSFRYLR